MDGIDVATIETDGQEIVALGQTGFFPYVEADRALLRGALAAATSLDDRRARPGCLALADAMVTSRHAEAVEAFLAADPIDRGAVDLIGFHGQTVQIGDGKALAQRLGIRVVHDFAPPMSRRAGKGRRWCLCFIARLPPQRAFWSPSRS
jgi:anhydro-N-acetylmuramic acid kinase